MKGSPAFLAHSTDYPSAPPPESGTGKLCPDETMSTQQQPGPQVGQMFRVYQVLHRDDKREEREFICQYVGYIVERTENDWGIPEYVKQQCFQERGLMQLHRFPAHDFPEYTSSGPGPNDNIEHYFHPIDHE